MPYRFRLSCSALAFMLVGCFSVDDDPAMVDSDTDAGTDGSTSSDPTGDPSTSGPTTTVSSSADSTGDAETEGGDPVCGDGEVNGDEVCDDGTNDGSYGSCLEDCSGMAEHCGDGEINGDEVCDDGRNDGSYGGCSSDCSALGPFCGDGAVQDPEMCDEGEDNENGSGCNVDCVTSGTRVHTYVSEEVLGTCDGETSNPVFRADGTILIAAVGWCGNNYAFTEFSPELELEDMTTPLLPEFPFRAAMRGDDWLLGGWGCDFTVSETGELDEICDDTRITGASSLEALDDSVYLAMRSGEVAHYGAGSPALGDSPNWTGEAPASGTSWLYSISRATFGAQGTVIASGYYRSGSSSPYTFYGYVRRWTAAGNVIDSRTYSDMTSFSEIKAAPDGGFVIRGSGNGNSLMKVQQNLNVVWAKPTSDFGDNCQWLSDFVVDSAGDIVLDCEGSNWPERYVIKLDPNGDERWSLDLELEYYSWGRMGIDANDYIVRSSVQYHNLVQEGHLHVDKISP